MFVVLSIEVNEIVGAQIGNAEDKSHAILVILFKRRRSFVSQPPIKQINGAFFEFSIVIRNRPKLLLLIRRSKLIVMLQFNKSRFVRVCYHFSHSNCLMCSQLSHNLYLVTLQVNIVDTDIEHLLEELIRYDWELFA